MDKLKIGTHISQQFNSDLEELKTQVLEMGGLVGQQVVDAVKVISAPEFDSALAQKIIAREDVIDQMEQDIDESCTLVLARRQPAASDLRMVLAVAKIVRDLERMGDESQKIAKMAISLNESGQAPRGYVELRHIGSLVHKMVNTVLDAFARYDVDLAIEAARDDTTIDQEYQSAMRELATYMMEDPRSITRVLDIMRALRALERIGDHTANIAEHIIYLVKGLDVRHQKIGDMEKTIKGR